MRALSETPAHHGRKPVKLVPAQDLLDHQQHLQDKIARRAFAIFESRGGLHGRALDDWLQAESELVHACRHDLRTTEEGFVLQADVPGSFTAEQLRVSVEPRRLMVKGERDSEVLCGDSSGTHLEKKSQCIFRVHELPADVDPSRTTATLKDGVLTIVMPRTKAAGTLGSKAKAVSQAG
jgi:HSP20 family protein